MAGKLSLDLIIKGLTKRTAEEWRRVDDKGIYKFHPYEKGKFEEGEIKGGVVPESSIANDYRYVWRRYLTKLDDFELIVEKEDYVHSYMSYEERTYDPEKTLYRVIILRGGNIFEMFESSHESITSLYNDIEEKVRNFEEEMQRKNKKESAKRLRKLLN